MEVTHERNVVGRIVKILTVGCDKRSKAVDVLLFSAGVAGRDTCYDANLRVDALVTKCWIKYWQNGCVAQHKEQLECYRIDGNMGK